jgi:hypothetical protein
LRPAAKSVEPPPSPPQAAPQRAAVQPQPKAVEPAPEPKHDAAPTPRTRPVEAAVHPRHEAPAASRNTRDQHTASRTSNDHRSAQPRREMYRTDPRHPQVRYYYYRDGKQVSFSEAFR